MWYYAQLTNGVVTAETESHSELPSSPDLILRHSNEPSVLGHSYDGSTFSPPVAAPAPRRITLGALQKRIGPMTVFAIDTSTHPVCVALRSYLSRLSYVGLDDPDLQPMLSMMVAAQMPEANPAFPGSGPLTAERVDAIISAEVEPEELP